MTDAPDILAGLVKPLEWKDYSAPHRAIYSATPPCGIYRITQRHFPEMHYKVETPMGMSISESTLEAAQAAANADHATRVLASLDADKLRALVEALEAILSIPNSEAAQGIMKCYARAALAALQELGQ